MGADLHSLLDVLTELHVKKIHLLQILLVLRRARVIGVAKHLHETLMVVGEAAVVHLTLEVVVELSWLNTRVIALPLSSK